MQKENPLTERLLRKGVFFLVLTAREPSVKPLADVIADYTRCDGQCKRDYKVHKTHPLPLIDRGRKADKYSITENSTHYNVEALISQGAVGIRKTLDFWHSNAYNRNAKENKVISIGSPKQQEAPLTLRLSKGLPAC